MHRSKSFWFGLFLLVLLVGCWVRSVRHIDGFSFGVGRHAVSFGQNDEGLYGYLVELPTSTGLGFRSQSLRVPPGSNEIWFPPALAWKHQAIPGLIEHRGLHVAHWLLVLVFIPAWAIRLLRRKKRLEANIEHPTSSIDPSPVALAKEER